MAKLSTMGRLGMVMAGPMRAWPKLLASLLAFGGLLATVGAGQVLGHDKNQHIDNQPAEGNAAAPSDVRVSIADVALIDRDGSPVRLGPDVLANRTVAIGLIYTACTTVCPVTASIFAQVQEQLGGRLGADVALVLISVDPARDTPTQMDRTARLYGARPGWFWLTGAKADIDRVLVGLGSYTPDFENHPPVVLVGSAATGRWVRLYGFVAPDVIVRQIDSLVPVRGRGETTKHVGD